MRTVLTPFARAVLALALVGAAACGSDAGSTESAAPTVVVTTSILGDIVRNLVGDQAQVTVIMAPGADPHEVAPSARQVAELRTADVLVVNGLGFEAGLLDTIDAARREGTQVVEATGGVDLIRDDPHFFTDPLRTRDAAAYLAKELTERVAGLDTPAYRARVDGYLANLEELDADIQTVLASVTPDRRVLVTNHESFAYFADRYDFEVVGTVIPGGSSLAEPSAQSLRTLADLIAQIGVPAIFAETSSPARLANALAAEGAATDVVELYTESLGPPGSAGATYGDMMRTNAERIAAALG